MVRNASNLTPTHRLGGQIRGFSVNGLGSLLLLSRSPNVVRCCWKRMRFALWVANQKAINGWWLTPLFKMSRCKTIFSFEAICTRKYKKWCPQAVLLSPRICICSLTSESRCASAPSSASSAPCGGQSHRPWCPKKESPGFLTERDKHDVMSRRVTFKPAYLKFKRAWVLLSV